MKSSFKLAGFKQQLFTFWMVLLFSSHFHSNAQISIVGDTTEGCIPYYTTLEVNDASQTANYFEWSNNWDETFYGQSVRFLIQEVGFAYISVVAFDTSNGNFNYVGQSDLMLMADGAGIATYPETDSICPESALEFYVRNYSDDLRSARWVFSHEVEDTIYTQFFRKTFPATGNYSVKLIAETDACGLVEIDQHFSVVDDLRPSPFEEVYLQRSAFCPNDIVRFYPSFFEEGTYEWDFGDGNSANTPYEATHRYAEEGTYQARLTFTNGCGNSETYTVEVNVQSGLLISPWNVDFQYPEENCPNEAIVFRPFFQDGDYEVFWDFGDQNTSTRYQPTHTYNAPGTYDVKMLVINGCGDSLLVSNSVSIEDNLPVEEFYLYAEGPVCPGDLIFMDAYGTEGTPTFEWDFRDGNTATGSEVRHAYQSTGIYEVLVTATNGCNNTRVDSISVEVRDDLQVEYLEYYITPENPCPGDTVYFFSLESNNGSFDLGNGTIIEAQDTFQIEEGFYVFYGKYVFDAIGNFQGTYTAMNGCGNVGTMPFRVNVTEGQSVSSLQVFAPADLSVCASFELNWESNGASRYTVDFGDGNIQNFALPFTTYTYSSPGEYTLTITAENNCGSSRSQSRTIRVHPDKMHQMTWSEPENGTVHQACEEVTFTATTGGTKYVWELNGETIETTIGELRYTFEEANIYQIVVNIHNDCGGSQSIARELTVEGDCETNATLSHHESLDLRLFPNPSNGISKLVYTLEATTSAQLQIFNVQGKLVHTESYRTLEAGKHSLDLNAQELQMKPGTYVGRLMTESGNATFKWMILP